MKSLLKIIYLFLFNLTTLAQSVTILPNGITPTAGNIPSLSYDAIMALPTPGVGSLATDLTFKCLRFYNGTTWAKVSTNVDTNPAAVSAWSEGTISAEGGNDVAVDTNGNVFVTGGFTGTTTIGNNTFVSKGSIDVFIAKYTKEGAFVWSKAGGGVASETVYSIIVDKNEGVYITGIFSGTVTFEDITLTSNGGTDIFIVKYKANGALEWAQKAGGNGYDIVNNMKTDPNGNIYLLGSFENTAFFGNAFMTSVGKKDIFIAKFNTAGTLQWVQKAGGVNEDNAYGIAIDSNGIVYIAGEFSLDVSFGNTTLTSGGVNDVFIARYNPSNATWEWAKRAGGTGDESARNIAVSNDGSVIVAGRFENTANFNSYSLTSEGKSDVFIAMYSAAGAVIWVKREGGKNDEFITEMDLDAEDNIYLSGGYNGLGNIGNAFLTNNGGFDIFISKFNAVGNFKWIQKIGSTGDDSVRGLAVQPDGNMYITGSFLHPLDFGKFSLTSAGGNDIFVARIRD